MQWNNCTRCHHAWPRKTIAAPVMCPKCKSRLWNKPRKRFSPKYSKKLLPHTHKRVIDPTPGQIAERAVLLRMGA